jgi:hypothetical protein
MHLDVMVMVESLLYGWWFVTVSKLDVPVVVFHPGQNTFHLSNKDITIFTGDALHIQFSIPCHPLQMREVGYLGYVWMVFC